MGQRDKLNYNIVVIETLANPLRSAHAGLALLSYPELRQRGQDFVPVCWMWTDPGRGCNVRQDSSLWQV